ncbi:MAG: sugar phosphate isomerase/epimerase family protein [Acutalibacteraceae bacterium]
MTYGIQLYSVRDLAERDLEEAVRRMARLGYRQVEFAGFFGRSPAQVNAMLAENGMTVFGTHSGFDELVNDYDATVAFHKAIGNRHFIVPGYDLGSQEKLDRFVALAGPLSERLAAEGITLGYHNHAHEFRPNPDGSVIYEQLLYRTNLKLEVDAYWAYVGMGDPVALLRRVKDRLISIHIKDGTADGAGKPLGMGEAPVAAMWETARQLGVPMIVESETLTPDGPTEAAICIDYLRQLETNA